MKKSTYLFLGLLVCGVAGGGYYWHQEQKFNDPNGIKITLNPIQPTQYQAKGGEIIAPLVIDFSANIVAPNQVNAPIAQGIKGSGHGKMNTHWLFCRRKIGRRGKNIR